MKKYLAIDVSFAHVKFYLGEMAADGVRLEQIDFFGNRLVPVFGHRTIDVLGIYSNILTVLHRLTREGVELTSIGICDPGNSLCFFGADNMLLSYPFVSADLRRDVDVSKFYTNISRQKYFSATGAQLYADSAILQLDALRRMGNTALAVCDKVLFLSDALSYMLTGKFYTNRSQASMGGLLNIHTMQLDPSTLGSVGLNVSSFGSLVEPCTVYEMMHHSIAGRVGMKPVPIICTAGVDKLSAIGAMPVSIWDSGLMVLGNTSIIGYEVEQPVADSHYAMVGCGNVIGLGDTKGVSKVLRGTSLLWRVSREWGETLTDDEAQMLSRSAKVRNSVFNPEDQMFENPSSLTKTIQLYCEMTAQEVPESKADIIRCIYQSLANSYAEAFGSISAATDIYGIDFFICGSWKGNTMFFQFLSNALNRRLTYGPQCASAIGNVISQSIAAGEIYDVWDGRARVRRFAELTSFEPRKI